MCMKYVNANAVLFKSVAKSNNDIVGLLEPFDCIAADDSNGIIAIKEFNIISYISLLGSSNKQAQNILDTQDTLQVCIRLTKCTKNIDERLSVDLDKFDIVTKDSNDIVYDACVPYLNFKRITHIDNIELDIANPKGNYVIKILAKTPRQDKYTVQALCHLKVE